MAKPHLRLVAPVPHRRPVLSVYYRGRLVVKTNRSGNSLRAATKAGEYMRTNKYEATVCEVYDSEDATLYAVIKRDMKGNVHQLYEREYDEEAGV